MFIELRSVLLFLLMLVLPFISAHAQYYAVKDDSTKTRTEVPAAIVKGFRQVFPTIPADTLISWEVYGPPNDYYYVVQVGKQGADFNAKGEVGQTFLKMQMSSLPKPVQRRAKQIIRKGGYQEGPVYAYTSVKDKEVWYYVIGIFDSFKPRRNRDLLIQPDGKFYNPKFR